MGQLVVADRVDGSFTRAILTFDLPPLPDGAEIISAILHSSVASSDQGLYAAMGPVVDHVDSTTFVAESFDAVARSRPSRR